MNKYALAKVGQMERIVNPILRKSRYVKSSEVNEVIRELESEGWKKVKHAKNHGMSDLKFEKCVI